MPNNLDAAIQSIVARAAADVVRVVKQSIADEINRLSSGSVGGSRGGRVARQPALPSSGGGGGGRGGRQAPQKASGRGGRRGRSGSPSENDLRTVHDFVRGNSGLRSEEIQQRLGGEPELIRKALAKLRATGQVRTEGQKRATVYFNA